VLLATDDLGTARAVAREVRASSGGLPAVQARAFLVGGRAQVSLNLLDVDVTPPLVAVETIAREAERLGTTIASSEVVGLLPERAVPAAGSAALHLAGSLADLMLEPRLRRIAAGARAEATRRGTAWLSP
jgi:glutamate formiminotransferase